MYLAKFYSLISKLNGNKNLRVFITIILFSCAFCNTKSAQSLVYKGAWFQINYPLGFTAKGSQKSLSADGFDSATFTSPDQDVEFYVFSPQWNGDAQDIILQTNEKLSSTTSQQNGDHTTTWWTISAKDGSYFRSYQQKTNTVYHTNCIFGIRYKNQSALKTYTLQYSKFKSSLIPFAD